MPFEGGCICGGIPKKSLACFDCCTGQQGQISNSIRQLPRKAAAAKGLEGGCLTYLTNLSIAVVEELN